MQFNPRMFSLEEANALLPKLREILDDLQKAREQVMERRARLTEQHHGGRGNGVAKAGSAVERLNADIQEAETNVQQAARAITDLGCELKDPDRGMVDFRTVREGRVVYLCWLKHESEVAFWHELEGGYAGRQPL
jgi:hypothetical protein